MIDDKVRVQKKKDVLQATEFAFCKAIKKT